MATENESESRREEPLRVSTCNLCPIFAIFLLEYNNGTIFSLGLTPNLPCGSGRFGDKHDQSVGQLQSWSVDLQKKDRIPKNSLFPPSVHFSVAPSCQMASRSCFAASSGRRWLFQVRAARGDIGRTLSGCLRRRRRDDVTERKTKKTCWSGARGRRRD